MEYKLYTLVDITHTGQHRIEAGKEELRWKEQNFQTVLQSIGIRGNVSFDHKPDVLEVAGNLVGFDTTEIIKVWRFDFSTERDYLYEENGDPVAYLKDDIHLVPYISGLDEEMEQQHAVFNAKSVGANIVFHLKQ